MGRETCHIFLNLGVFLIAILLAAKTLALFRAIIDIIKEFIILHRHKCCEARFTVHLPGQHDCHPQQPFKYFNKCSATRKIAKDAGLAPTLQPRHLTKIFFSR